MIALPPLAPRCGHHAKLLTAASAAAKVIIYKSRGELSMYISATQNFMCACSHFDLKKYMLKNIQDISLVFRNFVFTFVYFQFCPKQKSGRWFLSTKF